MRRHGLTLVELLVIVVIIAVLAAILFPVFGRSGHSVYRASCLSNLKQISLGMQQYVGDYDGAYPMATSPRTGHWVGVLQPYTKSEQLFRCPSTKRQSRRTTDYFLNGHLDGWKSRVPFPVSTVMFGDGQDDSPWNYTLVNLSREWRLNHDSPSYRHRQAAIYAFVDGHAKPLKPHQVTIDPPGPAVFTFSVQ